MGPPGPKVQLQQLGRWVEGQPTRGSAPVPGRAHSWCPRRASQRASAPPPQPAAESLRSRPALGVWAHISPHCSQACTSGNPKCQLSFPLIAESQGKRSVSSLTDLNILHVRQIPHRWAQRSVRSCDLPAPPLLLSRDGCFRRIPGVDKARRTSLRLNACVCPYFLLSENPPESPNSEGRPLVKARDGHCQNTF